MAQTVKTSRLAISETCRVPKCGFGVIYLDPPWHYDDKLDHDNMRGGAESHYPVLKPKDLENISFDPIAADDCAMFLWVTSPQMDVAIHLIEAWEFEYKTFGFVWRKMYKSGKPQFGLGRWTRSNYEFVLLATRGRPSRVDKGIRQEIQAVFGRHSAKPKRVRDRIDRLMGEEIPKVELFARDKHPGWQATGLDLDGVDIRDTILFRPGGKNVTE